MNKRFCVIIVIIFFMMCSMIANPVLAEKYEDNIFGRIRIKAIGTFANCNVDEVVYGHIFIGFISGKPVFNLDIEICHDSIKWIIMSNHFLNCAIEEK